MFVFEFWRMRQVDILSWKIFRLPVSLTIEDGMLREVMCSWGVEDR